MTQQQISDQIAAIKKISAEANTPEKARALLISAGIINGLDQFKCACITVWGEVLPVLNDPKFSFNSVRFIKYIDGTPMAISDKDIKLIWRRKKI